MIRILFPAQKEFAQLLLDGSEDKTGSIALGYTRGILQRCSFNRTIQLSMMAEILTETGMPPIALEPGVRLNYFQLHYLGLSVPSSSPVAFFWFFLAWGRGRLLAFVFRP